MCAYVCVLFQLMPFVLRVSICFCCFSANEHCDEAVPLVLCGESVLLCLFFSFGQDHKLFLWLVFDEAGS